MGLVFLARLTEVIGPPSNGPNIFQIIGMVGGILGIVALLTLPWTIKKLSAETRSIEFNTETGASEIALKHLKLALDEADKAINRIRDEAQVKIVGLEQQMARLAQTLEAEREKSERERELYEKRVVQLLYEVHAKDLEIARLRQGHIGPASSTSL